MQRSKRSFLLGGGLRRVAVLVVLLIAVGGLTVLGVQVKRELSLLSRAPKDNLQWSLAQLEVELLLADSAAQTAQAGDAGSLDAFRQRFDIFYSRVATLLGSGFVESLPLASPLRRSLVTARVQLDGMASLIDGPDESLYAATGSLSRKLRDLHPSIRAVALEGVRIFAQGSDEHRKEFSVLLSETAYVALGLILALGAALFALNRQHRLAVRKTLEAERSYHRLESTINASLDAIVVADADGIITAYNPAAEKVFGYSRAQAIGGQIETLLMPERFRDAHRRVKQRFLTEGRGNLLRGGRIELEALRANGEEFPVELSLGWTTGTQGPIFIAYVRDISAQRSAQRQLMEARDRALAADKAKSNFLTVMSHEMRTPLNGVIGVLELLKETDLDEEQQRLIAITAASGDILLQHISDVLDLAVIEAGTLVLQEDPFSLRDLLAEAAAINRPLAEMKSNDITVKLSLADNDPAIFIGDKLRIQQVLLNLVSNAIKFTESGSIDIEAGLRQPADGHELIELAVRDTGTGIAAPDQRRIFEEFVMLDASYGRTASGTGLGLSICHRLVKRMGGEIGVESEVGKGSRFWARLPLGRAAPSDAKSSAGDRSPQFHGTQVSLHALIVEDNEVNLFVARRMLARQGLQISTASTGEQGVSAAARQSFDLILMDISMPGMDGLEACRLIRAGGRSAKALIIGLTAHALPSERQSFIDAGMDDCLIKPIRRRTIEEIVAAVMESAVSQSGAEQSRQRDTVGGQSLNGGGLSEEAASAPLDTATLSELSDVLSPGSLAAKADQLALEIARGQREFAELLAAGTPAEAGRQAHRLLGAVSLFGAGALRAPLMAFEEYCKQGETEAATLLLPAIATASEHFLAALQDWRLHQQHPAPH